MVENDITSLDEFNSLLRKKKQKALEVSEELNLYYVAITRARNSLDDRTQNRAYLRMTK